MKETLFFVLLWTCTASHFYCDMTGGSWKVEDKGEKLAVCDRWPKQCKLIVSGGVISTINAKQTPQLVTWFILIESYRSPLLCVVHLTCVCTALYPQLYIFIGIEVLHRWVWVLQECVCVCIGCIGVQCMSTISCISLFNNNHSTHSHFVYIL